MERIAVISDIHGNVPALEAVLSDIRGRGIARIVCLGDLVGKGPEPAEAVDLVRSSCEIVVQGNWDLGINMPQDKEGGLWQQQRLGGERLAYLRHLPFSLDLTLSGRRVRLFHASAVSVYHRVLRKSPKTDKLAMFDNTELTGAFPGGSSPDVVIYGDIHKTYMHTLRGKDGSGLILYNCGSVGAPYDGIPQACYAIIEGVAEGGEAAPFSLQTVRVPYDIERAIRIAEQVGMPGLERFRSEMRTGREQP
ncbi:metallophosphoesterase family protein [Paenibacillus ginsengihumi]|uniref:metallophosphoesterase family protein n=1 Tax=Paenibacillus ginsengihumi TaxID=431596 RepID=UPI0003689379|nr:metallophosphoesterase family protein [Paenibacillus ginsengihumi]